MDKGYILFIVYQALVWGILAYVALIALVFKVKHTKVGSMHHWRLGRIGGSFYIAKRKRASLKPAAPDVDMLGYEATAWWRQ